MPPTLSEEFRAAQDCVYLRYPAGWKIDITGALNRDYPALCPGFPRSGKTTIVPDCDHIFSDVVSSVIDLGSGELRPNGGGRPTSVSLTRWQKGCPDPSGDATRRARYIRNTGGKVIDQTSAVVSGHPASCIQYQTAHVADETVQCFFDFDGVRYSFSATAEDAAWSVFSPTAYAIRDSVQFKLFPACASPSFPQDLAHFCP